MKAEAMKIIDRAKGAGWVIEPLAREILSMYNLKGTRYSWPRTEEEALSEAGRLGYPLVAKIVSAEILHKSDSGGVIVGIGDDKQMAGAYKKLSRLKGFDGVLLSAMASGVELIIGSKKDPQFGVIVLAGIGGTSVEIYKDVSIGMAPLSKERARDLLAALKGTKLLSGYRGSKPVNMNRLVQLLADFSRMAYDLKEEVESIDLNPVFAGSREALIADARIVLSG